MALTEHFAVLRQFDTLLQPERNILSVPLPVRFVLKSDWFVIQVFVSGSCSKNLMVMAELVAHARWLAWLHLSLILK